LGLPITRRKSPENALVVTLKDPINTVNVRNIEARAKNVFLRVDIYPTLTYI